MTSAAPTSTVSASVAPGNHTVAKNLTITSTTSSRISATANTTVSTSTAATAGNISGAPALSVKSGVTAALMVTGIGLGMLLA
jgi:hypothetical protein